MKKLLEVLLGIWCYQKILFQAFVSNWKNENNELVSFNGQSITLELSIEKTCFLR